MNYSLEEKRHLNLKALKRLELKATPDRETLILYSLCDSFKEKKRLWALGSGSFALTTAFLVSRMPGLHRYARLAIYGGLGIGMYQAQLDCKRYYMEETFR